MSFSIIRDCAGVTFNDYCHIDWIDLLVTICYIECYFAEVCVRISELLLRKFHIRSTSISSRCCSSTAECEVRLCIQRCAERYIISAYRMFFTVIIACVLMTSNGYCCLYRSDLLITICNIECYISEVRIIVCELCRSQTHICLAVSIRTHQQHVFLMQLLFH